MRNDPFDAVENEDLDGLRVILDSGQDVNAFRGRLSLIALAVDVEGDGTLQSGVPLHVDTTALLLARGADPHLRQADGESAVEVAQYYNHWLALELFNWRDRLLPGSDRRVATKTSRQPFMRIKLTADGNAPFTVMFEPSGMTYELAAGEGMFADVIEPFTRELEVVNWQGGISIWAPGAVVTRDADGRELDPPN